MLPSEDLSVDQRADHSNQSEGNVSLKSAQEILLVCDPVSRGNTIPADLISKQPLPAAALHASERTQPDLQTPTCPRCGLTVPEPRLPPLSSSQLQSSKLSVHSGGSRRSRSRSSVSGSHRPAATPADSWFHLLLACLDCRCSVLLLGLLEACSSCLGGLCSSCCRACARCCSAIQDAPVEELNCHAHCHSVLFESCCEHTECLEFCVECCEICHRS
ncbi:myoD family inhibitor domain-containing protein-like [Parambassis ranga]|uniref:MyoD family inhibitor domain-containing protein-like n=1 Tax=Parambassis ranga TaxID=210632 RepID=A0A6P7KJ89_9TELE|nr:myoD family inhibitor domain-containing protein-like [Parambassis ranga]